MSNREIAMKSKYCSGCHRTVDLHPAGGTEARCPVCGRSYLVPASAPESTRVAGEAGSSRRAA